MKSTFAKAGGSILKQFSNIWDPHKDLLIKQQAANDVASSVTAITTDYQAFLANVTNVIFAADDAAEKENLPE
jgi:hypothetical protein